MSRSFLHTSRTGAPDGAPLLAFHNRYGVLEDAEALALNFSDRMLRIAVRSPRAQSAGGSGITAGYFWYIAPVDQPELSTLGDGLYQVELLIEETLALSGGKKLVLFGEGEGGVIATLAALIFPDKVAALVIKDTPFPTNTDQMPVEFSALACMPVLLSGEHAEATNAILAARGGNTTIVEAITPDAVASFLAANS